MSKHPPPISPGHTIELAEMFALLGEINRLRIVLSCLHEPVNVGDLAARLGLSPSLVSHHLRLLRGARLLRADRHGKHVFYVAEDEHVRAMLSDMVTHAAETRR